MKQSTLIKRLNKALTATYIDGKDRYSNSDYAVMMVKRYITNGSQIIETHYFGENHSVKIIKLLNAMGLKYTICVNLIKIQQRVIFPNEQIESHVELI